MRLIPFGGKTWCTLVVLAAAVAAAAWFGWAPILSWYYLRGLAAAEAPEREAWVQRVVSLDAAALPGLFDCLKRADARVCANAEAALGCLARKWGPGDARTLALAVQIRNEFPSLSTPGQEAVLEWQVALLAPAEGQSALAGPLLRAARALLPVAAERADKGVRLRALALADVLLDQPETGPWLKCCEDLIHKGLKDAEAQTRVRAVHLTLHARFRQDEGLLREVAPLLADADAGVRGAALLAVAIAKEIVPEDELLPLLHDPNEGVRKMCETTLRSRGLHDGHILMARKISDSRASARLEVVEDLQHDSELDQGVWLQRLSQDPSPAVRAAAVRAAAEQSRTDLGDRLREMAEGDPSPTVRQLAAFYVRPR